MADGGPPPDKAEPFRWLTDLARRAAADSALAGAPLLAEYARRLGAWDGAAHSDAFGLALRFVMDHDERMSLRTCSKPLLEGLCDSAAEPVPPPQAPTGASPELEEHLSTRTFMNGARPSCCDLAQLAVVPEAPAVDLFPHTARWHWLVSRLRGTVELPADAACSDECLPACVGDEAPLPEDTAWPRDAAAARVVVRDRVRAIAEDEIRVHSQTVALLLARYKYEYFPFFGALERVARGLLARHAGLSEADASQYATVVAPTYLVRYHLAHGDRASYRALQTGDAAVHVAALHAVALAARRRRGRLESLWSRFVAPRTAIAWVDLRTLLEEELRLGRGLLSEEVEGALCDVVAECGRGRSWVDAGAFRHLAATLLSSDVGALAADRVAASTKYTAGVHAQRRRAPDERPLRFGGPFYDGWLLTLGVAGGAQRVVSPLGVVGGRAPTSLPVDRFFGPFAQEGTVSREHFQIAFNWRTQRFELSDGGSLTGTFLRVRGGERVRLRAGAVLLVGQHEVAVTALRCGADAGEFAADRVEAAHDRRQRLTALAMGTHARLGAASPVRRVPTVVLRLVARFLGAAPLVAPLGAHQPESTAVDVQQWVEGELGLPRRVTLALAQRGVLTLAALAALSPADMAPLAPEVGEAEAAALLARPPPAAFLDSSSSGGEPLLRLRVVRPITSPLWGEEWDLRPRRNSGRRCQWTVGRRRDADVAFCSSDSGSGLGLAPPLAPVDQQVSSVHARVLFEDGAFFVVDGNRRGKASTNGTWLRLSAPLAPSREPVPLTHHDEFRVACMPVTVKYGGAQVHYLTEQTWASGVVASNLRRAYRVS